MRFYDRRGGWGGLARGLGRFGVRLGLIAVALIPVLLVAAAVWDQHNPRTLVQLEGWTGRVRIDPVTYAGFTILTLILAGLVFGLRRLGRLAAARALTDLRGRSERETLRHGRALIRQALGVFDAGLDVVQAEPVGARDRRRFAHKHFTDQPPRGDQGHVLAVVDFFDEIGRMVERGLLERGDVLALFGEDLRAADRYARPLVLMGQMRDHHAAQPPPEGLRRTAFLRLADRAWGFDANDRAIARRLLEGVALP